ncbi:hypothetical protein SEA_BRAYBEAST_7 [Arthrobacter phage BrayBeast]
MGLKKYEVTTDSGYTTTLQLSDEDAKERGLKGKDIESVAAAQADAKATAEAEAQAKADAEAKAAAEAEAQAKQASTPQNKQAKPASDK